MATVHKAQPIGGTTEIPELEIKTSSTVPNSIRFDELNKLMDRDAQAIVDDLYRSLPGGTIDRVLAKLMARQASSLVVVHQVWSREP